ncbi:hypothetical protein SEVIR_3G184100v4 [Setaria viridis]|uniref:Uncharacterized protein n=2 Tax=Setaria TaxID=4554 RepID=K3ZCJ2_SETIT|nr:hypothetical protein SETIT_3G179800v2 [Setaria italica]TKW26367.1 hypothetical protein SEVIR_3G184100v2 [Setaria viridis]
MAARAVSIALLVILVVGAELVAVPEARLIQGASPSFAVTCGDGESAGVRWPSKWNRGRVLGGEKRSVPGGPDPQHHY